ncbi:MAG: hybrid sensor histidine kinase/response regulator [Elusimicrobia bacterium]|nr:hybrid sensor histidine kinase/response regulator [Elusimicrobiota bacterium]
MQKIKASALVVDDQEEMLLLCSQVARGVVTEVEEASSSAAARAAFHKRTFDLLLTDINIDKDGDGVALAREIRNISPDTKVIMMTADPTLETAIGGLKSGASEYIIKPFAMDYLGSVIRAVFEKAELSSELAREKAMKKELEDAYSELKASESAKDAFLGRVNHELRTPLAIAVTACEILGQQLTGQQKELWTRTDKALRWLQLEIDQLLLYSGLLKGELKIEKQETDLWALLNEVSDGLKSIYEDMSIKVELAAEGERWLVLADAKLIREAFRQLLVNGVKFNKKGGAISVRARYGADHAAFSFTDTGPGVSDETMPHLFGSFFQAADYLTREVGGIGLGLATVKRIAEVHGGGVAAQKRPEGGMVFSISLPRKV